MYITVFAVRCSFCPPRQARLACIEFVNQKTYTARNLALAGSAPSTSTKRAFLAVSAATSLRCLTLSLSLKTLEDVSKT